MNQLTTPSLVNPKDGRGVSQDEYARIPNPSRIQSILASLPISASVESANDTYIPIDRNDCSSN